MKKKDDCISHMQQQDMVSHQHKIDYGVSKKSVKANMFVEQIS